MAQKVHTLKASTHRIESEEESDVMVSDSDAGDKDKKAKRTKPTAATSQKQVPGTRFINKTKAE